MNPELQIDWLVLRAHVQTALLFNIRPSVVCISIDWLDTNVFLMRVQLDVEPSEDDKDMYYGAAAEVCGHFASNVSSEVSFISSTSIYAANQHLERLVYARAEH